MAQKKETKTKDKPQAKPVEATLNKYGFVHFGKSTRSTWVASEEDINLNVEVGEGKVTFSRKVNT